MDPCPPSFDSRRCTFRLPVGRSAYCEIEVPLALAPCIGPFARVNAFRRDGGLLDMHVRRAGQGPR